MQERSDTGCLTQRSHLERLLERADALVHERVNHLSSPSAKVATILIVLGPGHEESTWDVESLASNGARLGRGTQWMVDPEVALANFVPTQSIMRILREASATAAALVAPVATATIAMQLADADHEQSLTARVIRQPEASPVLGKWDFGSVLWTVRLRQMLLASGARGRVSTGHVLPTTRSVPALPAAAPGPTGGRRGQMREMREQLQREPAAAPSWLQ